MRRIRLAAAAVLIGAVVGGGPALAAPTEGNGTTREAARGTAAADIPVPLPDLGIAHRHPNGSTILWRLPLSELEADYGRPQVVRSLGPAFPFDKVRVIAGDIGDITAGDDGTTDFVLWQRAGDGSVRVYGVGGGSDTAPRLWHTLRAPWSWAYSRPMVGDVTGDGWDDLVVRHWAGCIWGSCYVNVYVFESDGRRLGAPRPWFRVRTRPGGLDDHRNMLADVGDDGLEDWAWVRGTSGPGFDFAYRRSTGAAFEPIDEVLMSVRQTNWSYADSRQLLGDVFGSGGAFPITVHRAGVDGFRLLGATSVWADLSTRPWSFAASRQYLADTNGDGREDVITVHRSGSGGIVVWRHLSTGARFAAPQAIVHLRRENGWQWAYSRETVADTWGILTTP